MLLRGRVAAADNVARREVVFAPTRTGVVPAAHERAAIATAPTHSYN
eukprot:SAG22_NODE_363_length_11694_cov_40.815783_11_plen_47_part_00